jgi:hypothetical protein
MWWAILLGRNLDSITTGRMSILKLRDKVIIQCCPLQRVSNMGFGYLLSFWDTYWELNQSFFGGHIVLTTDELYRIQTVKAITKI